MFLARIDGNLVASHKHPTLVGCRFLIGQRLEADGQPGGEPLVILDWMGADRGSVVIVSTDGDLSRERFGNTVPGRLAVLGLVDAGGAS
jgi:ethanolamine utilization protein EutN